MLLSQALRNKYRPPLSLVIAVVLGIMLLVPLAGIAFFRIYENQLIQATEGELIAQSAAIAAATAQRLSEFGGSDLALGPVVAAAFPDDYASEQTETGSWTPVQPELDLNRTRILTARPAATIPEKTPDPAYLRAGKEMGQVLLNTQMITLAGFRILDFNGVVIAGRGDVGWSLGHVDEIRRALSGRYASALRARDVNNPQPIYSISRGTSVRVFTALPIIIDNRVAGVVYSSRTPSNILKELYLKRGAVLGMVLFVIGATCVVGFIFARAISGPIKALTSRSLRIGRGDRSAIKPLAIHGNREIHALSTSMLDMSRKLFERNDYINTFANHVTHELKTPLTAIHGATELMLDGGDTLSEVERARFLKNILTDTERASALLSRLRELARADAVDIGGSCQVSEVLGELRARFEGLEIVAVQDFTLPLSPENARIVLENLLDNSARHGASLVILSLAAGPNGETLTIEDNGEGISKGNEKQIFDLFFTSRRDKGGTGMGLVIARALLKSHGAEIHHVPGTAGATFEILFMRRIEAGVFQ